MNQSQIKHLKERLRSIYYEKRASATKSGFTFEEKLRLYEEGKVSIDYNPVRKQFLIVFEGEEEFKNQQSKVFSQIDKDYNDLLDQLILGDAEEALKMLNSFRDKEYK